MPTPISLFDYDLPPERIAQHSVEPRDQSRLLILGRQTGSIRHRRFFELGEELYAGDVLVMNDTRVFKARLRGYVNGKEVEVFLLRHRENGVWEALLRPGRKAALGDVIRLDGLLDSLDARVLEKYPDGTVVLDMEADLDAVLAFTEAHGEVPVPPYVEGDPQALSGYQTVYASKTGSVAAPTAGFHFTERLMEELRKKGVQFEFVTLHVGVGTFRPVKVETLEEHEMHAEFVQIDAGTASRINAAKSEGRRVIAVGTTTVRALEGAARETDSRDPLSSPLVRGTRVPIPDSSPYQGEARRGLPPRGFVGDVNLFITPGFDFRVIDGFITNFHLPKSTLLVLVSAFAGREPVLNAYREAIKEGYRFYSFGDAMLIL
ncbi:tRNA preQ1(34) S-adenosylmethionine ribosyltransferase-isomerase QueA [Candidatus Uhrbacteria bacterium]|nr:tRNA preQ1(34) S-adenosylmethionine ribosyltransferase-isomerase QueA [Candidatus Uhrbacteria bacterium]